MCTWCVTTQYRRNKIWDRKPFCRLFHYFLCNRKFSVCTPLRTWKKSILERRYRTNYRTVEVFLLTSAISPQQPKNHGKTIVKKRMYSLQLVGKNILITIKLYDNILHTKKKKSTLLNRENVEKTAVTRCPGALCVQVRRCWF